MSTTERKGNEDDRISIRVMSYNIWYGGEQVNLQDTADAIKNARPDIVGVQECDANLFELSKLCGLPHVDERRFIISRFPIFDSGGTGRKTEKGSAAYSINGLDSKAVHAWILIAPGKVIGFANTHQRWDSYGPDLVAEGVPADDLMEIEEEARGDDARALSKALRGLTKTATPVFLTGDFNCPSHLDWTEDMVGQLPQICYAFAWPSSVAMEKIGMTDTFRAAHPLPTKKPGLTFGLDSLASDQTSPDELTSSQPASKLTVPEPLSCDQYRDRIDFIYASGDVEVVDSWVLSKTRAAVLDANKGGVSRAASNFPWPSDHSAVMTLALVRPVPAPCLINVQQRRVVRYKEAVNIGVTVPDGNSWSVVIVPAEGSPETDVLTGMYNEPILHRRSVRFGTNIMIPREYDAVLLACDETMGEIARVRFAIIDEHSIPAVWVSHQEAGIKDTITISWREGPGDRHDFLAVYDQSSRPDVNRFLAMIYTQGQFSGSVDVCLSDEKIFAAPLAVGKYNVMLMHNDQFVELARASFELVDSSS